MLIAHLVLLRVLGVLLVCCFSRTSNSSGVIVLNLRDFPGTEPSASLDKPSSGPESVWSLPSSPGKVLNIDNITYLVSARRSIEIWRVCKIYGRRGGRSIELWRVCKTYGRRGGAEPSIYFTNPQYFYRSSGN